MAGEMNAEDEAKANAYVALSAEELLEHIRPSFSYDEVTSVDSFLKTAAKTLCFQVVSRNEKSVTLQPKGSFDWLSMLNLNISASYNLISFGMEPRPQEQAIECKSMSGLRNALRDMREARMNATFDSAEKKQAVAESSTWEIASAIVITQTVHKNLVVTGKHIRWCESDWKSDSGFTMNIPLYIRAGSAVKVDRTSLEIEIDDGFKIRFFGVGRLAEPYDDDQILLCARPNSLCMKEKLGSWARAMVNELLSQWALSAVGQHSDRTVRTISVSGRGVCLA